MNQGDAMNRAEKESKVLRQDGKVFEANHLKINERYLNPNYSLVKCDPAVLEPNGLLKLFELRPKSGTGPSCIWRWDGGSRDPGKVEREDLDIDITGVSEAEKLRFEDGKDGNAGHHSKRIASTTGRTYEVVIRRPTGNTIFDGTVSFCVHRKMEFSASTSRFAATSARVILGKDKSKD